MRASSRSCGVRTSAPAWSASASGSSRWTLRASASSTSRGAWARRWATRAAAPAPYPSPGPATTTSNPSRSGSPSTPATVAVVVGRDPADHDAGVGAGRHLGADRIGDGRGHETCTGAQRSPGGERRGARGPDGAGDHQHPPARHLVGGGRVRGWAGAGRRQRGPAGRTWVVAGPEVTDHDLAGVPRPGVQQQAALASAEGDGQVRDDRAVAGAAVVRADTRGHVARHDGRATVVRHPERGGGRTGGAARRPLRPGAEEAVDRDVAPGEHLGEAIGAGRGPAPGVEPGGAARGRRRGHLDVGAVHGDDAYLRAGGVSAVRPSSRHRRCRPCRRRWRPATRRTDRPAAGPRERGGRRRAASARARCLPPRPRPGHRVGPPRVEQRHRLGSGAGPGGVGRDREPRLAVDRRPWVAHSTVTVLARLRGWSTSSPRAVATW
jgi:hypothetical protein